MATSPVPNDAEALAQYNRLFNPQTWKTARGLVADDVAHSERFAHVAAPQREIETARLMNLVTDAALDLCGHRLSQGACVTLVRVMDTNFGEAAREAVFAHLAQFTGPHDARLRDYRTMSAVLTSLTAARTHLQQAANRSSALGGWLGNALYFAVHAALTETLVAQRIVAGDSPDYLATKQRAVLTAVRECIYALCRLDAAHENELSPLLAMWKEERS